EHVRDHGLARALKPRVHRSCKVDLIETQKRGEVMSLMVVLLSLLSAIGNLISGTVSSAGSNGAPFVIPGADVTLLSTHGQTIGTTITDELGSYRIEGIAPGTYKLKIEMPGFEAFVADVVVTGNNPVRQAATLKLASVTGHVDVIDDAAMLSTKDATVGSVVE